MCLCDFKDDFLEIQKSYEAIDTKSLDPSADSNPNGFHLKVYPKDYLCAGDGKLRYWVDAFIYYELIFNVMYLGGILIYYIRTNFRISFKKS